jgi:hypothetical protein
LICCIPSEDLTKLPLLERKARLETQLRRAQAAIRFSSHVIGNGASVYEEASKQGLEGIVSKAIDAPYRSGNRGVWVKTKTLNRLEFVVVGSTDPEGSRPALGSLLLGYYGDVGKLTYAGRAGTGMTDSELHALVKRLRPLAVDKMPLAAPPPKNTRGKPLVLSRVHWVRPKLVAEVTDLTWARPTACCATSSTRACAKTRRRATFAASAKSVTSTPHQAGRRAVTFETNATRLAASLILRRKGRNCRQGREDAAIQRPIRAFAAFKQQRLRRSHTGH